MEALRFLLALGVTTTGMCLICQEGVVNKSYIMGYTLTGPGIYPNRAVFRAPAVTTWMFCARMCLLRSACKSLTYDYVSGVCKGYTVQANGDYTLTVGSTKSYTAIDDVPQSIAGPCAGHNCDPHELCVPEGLAGFHCTIVGRCSSAPEIPGAKIITFTPNEVTVYACENGYSNTETSPEYTSWCIWNDIWTPTSFNCLLATVNK